MFALGQRGQNLPSPTASPRSQHTQIHLHQLPHGSQQGSKALQERRPPHLHPHSRASLPPRRLQPAHFPPPGLPKAAVITEMKVMMVANLARMCGLRENDVVYTTLPLYHSAGLLIGVGGCLEVGMCPTAHGGLAGVKTARQG